MTIEIDTVEQYNTWDVEGEESARAVWAALPIEEAYPVGSQWVHPSRPQPMTIVGYTDSGLSVLVEGNEYPEGNPGSWGRSALDTYGRPWPIPGGVVVATPDSAPDVTEGRTFNRNETVPMGTRVRLVDAGGDSESSANVGDLGTVTYSDGWLLGATMDDGTTTRRNTNRFAFVSTPVVDTPVEAEFPVGYRFHTIEGHDDEEFVVIENVARGIKAQGNVCTGPQWFTEAQVRAATPVMTEEEDKPRAGGPLDGSADTDTTEEETEPVEVPVEPYRPSVGERVVVVTDVDEPDSNGKTAIVLEVRDPSYYQASDWRDMVTNHDYNIRVAYDEGSQYWLVKEVRPLMPATVEEYNAWVAKAVEAAKAEGVTQGQKEGREYAEAKAAEAMERIVESAHDYARRNELCRQFDLFMVENGLPPRETFRRDWEVTLSTTVVAASEESAMESVMESIRNGYLSFDIEPAEE